MTTRHGRRPRNPRNRSLAAAAILALSGGLQTGCGREFFREWANQDVSEAVFEKSRDPRWRLDLFSVEPPALSRFADPYDPDRPPAPPDDRASEALAPVPQWPDNRLLIPAEGTGYLDLLDNWHRNRPPAAAAAATPAPGVAPAPTLLPPAPGLPSPFTPSDRPAQPTTPLPIPGESPAPSVNPVPTSPGGNSGTGLGALSPTKGRGAALYFPLERAEGPNATGSGRMTAAGREAAPPRGTSRPRDLGVTLAAFQQTGLPLPVPSEAPVSGAASVPKPTSRDIKPPSIGMDPAPNVEQDLSNPPASPRTDQTPDQFKAAEAMVSALAGNLIPHAIDFNDAEAAGLKHDSTPYVISMNQAFTLALINSRVYQFQLENVYGSALAVTLQRFAFTPQFYAGMTPLTGVAGVGGFGGSIPAPNPANQFLYSTRETGTQLSSLNLGTVAGVGKLFDTGGRVLAGFANQVVFNFIGKNSIQPSVKSYLPLNIIQPFLRGGGRAVTLENLTLAERQLLYQVRLFAKFRQEFTVTTLVGGSITNFGSAVQSLGFTGGGNADPTPGFINIVEDVQLVENYRQNIAAFEQLITVFRELINGESSGLSLLQLDQVESGLQNAKLQYIASRTTYRNDLDSFKTQMGLPPDTPLMPDRSLTRRFKEVYDAVDEWQRDPRRELRDLTTIVDRLPNLDDIVLDGRSMLGVYTDGTNNEDGLEDFLLAVERLAMEHRLDLMNQRATLYDVWRQIKVQANSLQGTLNVQLTNQFLTPPTTTNPFAFLEQSKQFSLVFNAELPLVRMAERNNFRTALINYQRQRRALQNSEDSIKLFLRQEVRNAQSVYLNYQVLKRNFVLTIRQKDQALEQIIAPPQAGAGNAAAALQTTNLVNFQGSLTGIKNNLVTFWYNYIQLRLQIFRDLGTLPFDEWEAFSELFPSEPIGDGSAAAAAARDARPAGTPAAVAPTAVGGER